MSRSGSTIAAIIGPGCSAACETTASLALGQNLPQISHACTSPIFSQEKYALFSRTVSPNSNKAPAVAALAQLYNWTRAAMLKSTDDLWYLSGTAIAEHLQSERVEVTRYNFVPGNVTEHPEFQVTLTQLRRSGLRVVVLLAYGADTLAVAAAAREVGLTSTGRVWVLPKLFDEPNDDATKGAMDGWLYMSSPGSLEGLDRFSEQVVQRGKLGSEYANEPFNLTGSPPYTEAATTYAAALYDAVMLYAHAATKVLKQGGDLMDGPAVTAAVRSTPFRGVEGTSVVLDQAGDRLESYSVMNFQLGDDNTMRSVMVGLYNSTEQRYVPYDNAVLWPGKTTQVPVDYSFSSDCTGMTVTVVDMFKFGTVTSESGLAGRTVPLWDGGQVLEVESPRMDGTLTDTSVRLRPLGLDVSKRLDITTVGNLTRWVSSFTLNETGNYSLELHREGTSCKLVPSFAVACSRERGFHEVGAACRRAIGGEDASQIAAGAATAVLMVVGISSLFYYVRKDPRRFKKLIASFIMNEVEWLECSMECSMESSMILSMECSME